PYGTLSSNQLRGLAHVARRYDKDYGHFTTRQNIQYNWIKLEETPDILADLAKVEMHGIQTSGNSFRNITTDPFAGVTAEEIEDPRPWCEIIRQWSILHPEFSFLPRKFKIAVSAATEHDRAAVKMHDLGLYIRRNAEGEVGFQVLIGGGLGRTPYLGLVLREFLPKPDLLAYLEAALRVYNQYGRRDNIFKARVKILVHSLGIEKMREEVEAEFAAMAKDKLELPEAVVAAIRAQFSPPPYADAAADDAILQRLTAAEPAFARWVKYNTHAHRRPGHAIVCISLKPPGKPPGDCNAAQMELIADLAEELSHAEIRVTHEQNLVLPHVRKAVLYDLWRRLAAAGLASANIGLASDIIACPGLDYCGLATARSIPIAQVLGERLAAREETIGKLAIKISGCINACGHHHVGHIGILGLDKNGEEFYQLTIGGSDDEHAAIGSITGPAVAAKDVPEAVDKLIDTYIGLRQKGERFPETYRRVGMSPFKEALYAAR
ncbi:MAG TPA: nitrite/sulfite reductase, partial [Stellaceae bacterium]|nr:nitrite/sulfite reductase [Stellaceae bacterium]